MRGYDAIRRAGDLLTKPAPYTDALVRKVRKKGVEKPILIDSQNQVLACNAVAEVCKEIDEDMEVPVYVATQVRDTEVTEWEHYL